MVVGWWWRNWWCWKGLMKGWWWVGGNGEGGWWGRDKREKWSMEFFRQLINQLTN